jgi:hypothetical protein
MNSNSNMGLVDDAPQSKKGGRIRQKSSAHIIGILVSLRSREPNKNQFSAHISQEGWLGGGVGLVLWKINQVKTKSDDGYWQFFLGCRYAANLCPRNRESLITVLLMKAGIISLLRSGVKDYAPALYRLSDEWVGIPSLDFKLNEWQLNRLAIASEKSRQNQYKRQPWLRWVDECLSRVDLPESDALRTALQNPITEPSARNGMNFLRGYLSPTERKVALAKYVGTIYTPISSLPSEVVSTLMIDGEPVSQLDITSAHPSTIPCLLIEAEQKYQIAGGIAEAHQLAEALESGRFYDQLASELGIDTKAAKKRFLAALSGENRHTYNEELFQKFGEKFPVAKKVIGIIRRSDRKRLNAKMASLLARVISLTIETCSKLQIPVYPRTDEIVCRQRDEALVREILTAYFLDQTSVRARVGGEMISFIPKEGAQCSEAFATAGLPGLASLHSC